MLRRCRKCGGEFPLTKEFFGHMPNGGYRYTCRACVRANVRGHYYDDPQRSIGRSELRRGTVFTQSEREEVRTRLAARDGGFLCFYCKTPLDDSFHIDHKKPIAAGGTHEISNCALACMQCNQEKHNKDLEGYRAWLRKNGETIRF